MAGRGIRSAVAALAIGSSGCAAAGGDAIGSESVGSVERAIVGGQPSQPGAYAATGALVRGLTYRCTATLIAPDVAITAAHCLVGHGSGDFGFTLDPDLSDGPGDLVPLLAHHQHPDFRIDAPELLEIGRRDDVGVIILSEPLDGVAVELLDAGDALDRAPTDVSGAAQLELCGYGRDSWQLADTAGVKREAAVFVDHVADWELQTADEDPQPCRGDSGGPLFAQGPDGRRIVGLVSRAAGSSRMCDSGAIHTRVAPYADWIAEASLDRDTGCAAAGSGATWPLALLTGLLFAAARRGNRDRRSARPAAATGPARGRGADSTRAANVRYPCAVG